MDDDGSSEGHISDYPLRSVTKVWRTVLKRAFEFKQKQFQEYADEAMKFFHGGQELNELIWEDDDSLSRGTDDAELPAPTFRMQLNKVSELVQLFGPAMYHANPTIIVEPKTLNIPTDLLVAVTPPEVIQQAQQQYMMQAQQQQAQQMQRQPLPFPGQMPPGGAPGQPPGPPQPPPIPPFNPASLYPPDQEKPKNEMTATLLNYYLDYIQRENDKKSHARRMVDEALIKGMGVVWTGRFEQFPGATAQIGSFYDTVDNLLMDPDAEVPKDAKWMAQRCIAPYQDVEEEFNRPEGSLEKYATRASVSQDAATESDDNEKYWKRTGKTNDLLVYWKIYSKMGIGNRLTRPTQDGPKLLGGEFLPIVQKFGNLTYMVLVEGMSEFLNLRNEELVEAATSPKAEAEFDEQGEEIDPHEDLFDAVQWPVPYWAFGEWPVTPLAFHDVPNCIWPMSHIKPAMGQLKFINYCFSFLANKIRHSCRTLVGVLKSASDDLKATLLSGADFSVLELSEITGKSLNEVISYIQPPNFNRDIYTVLADVMELFDKATGMNEMMYAAQGGMRSAQEAQVKQGAMNIRPDDMASKVEDCMSMIARKEAMAARWLLEAEDLIPILGERGAMMWQEFVMSKDPQKIAREFNYRVEAGSARKPNKDTRVSQAQSMMQVLAPFYENYTMKTGDPTAFNAALLAWLESQNIEPKPEYFLKPPPPPAPVPPPPDKAAELQQKMQLDAQKGQIDAAAAQQKAQLEQQRMQMDLAQKQQEIQMQAQQQIFEIRAQQEQAKMKLDVIEAQLRIKKAAPPRPKVKA